MAGAKTEIGDVGNPYFVFLAPKHFNWIDLRQESTSRTKLYRRMMLAIWRT